MGGDISEEGESGGRSYKGEEISEEGESGGGEGRSYKGGGDK